MPSTNYVCFKCHCQSSTSSYCGKCAAVMALLSAEGNEDPWSKPYPGDRKAKARGKEMILEEDRKDLKAEEW